MQRSYIDYAMSVIMRHALPDVRDGLKPVHVRILYAMLDGGYRPDRGFFKCSRVIGDVMGNYHPHGDSAIYDALVRMAQPWSMRMPLIDSQERPSCSAWATIGQAQASGRSNPPGRSGMALRRARPADSNSSIDNRAAASEP